MNQKRRDTGTKAGFATQNGPDFWLVIHTSSACAGGVGPGGYRCMVRSGTGANSQGPPQMCRSDCKVTKKRAARNTQWHIGTGQSPLAGGARVLYRGAHCPAPHAGRSLRGALPSNQHHPLVVRRV